MRILSTDLRQLPLESAKSYLQIAGNARKTRGMGAGGDG